VWILDHPVTRHHASSGYVRITCSLKMNLITNFLEQLNNGSLWAFLIPPSTARDPWRAAGVPRALPQYLALSITMELRFHRPRDRGLISGLLDTIFHSVRTGSGVHPALNHEVVFQLPQMLRFRVCGGRLHLHPYTVRAWRWMKRKRNVSYT